jgi:HAD superfamily hydrolase (TIGR01490 family)
LKGISRVEGEVLRQQFFVDWIRQRIPADARALVEKHRSLGDELILTTATNRFITELTAREFGIDNLIAIEAECVGNVFTGKPNGVLNMREGKVLRLNQWLAERGWPSGLIDGGTFYSDSINDLPLLESVMFPIAVDPDDKLMAEARTRGWKIIMLDR